MNRTEQVLDIKEHGAPAQHGLERLDRAAVQAQGAQHHHAHRSGGGPDHLPDDGLHHLRQPVDPRRRGHAEGRGVRRHLPDRRARHAASWPSTPTTRSRWRRAWGSTPTSPTWSCCRWASRGRRRWARCSSRAACSCWSRVFRLRELIIRGIPHSIRIAITVGIGLFLAIIALKSAGIVAPSKATYVTLGDLHTPQVVLATLGFFLIVVLDRLKVPGAILIGIIARHGAVVLLRRQQLPRHRSRRRRRSRRPSCSSTSSRRCRAAS